MRTKIAIPLLTAAALFFGMSGMDALAGNSNAEIRYYGDLDGDEVISSYDLVMLRQCIYDYERFDTAQHYISDLDADGTIGKSDLELLSDYLLGKISAFPAGEYITKDIYAPAQISFIEPSITAMGASMPSQGDAGMVVFCVDFPDCRFSAEPDMNDMEAAVFGAEDTSSPMYPFESIAAFYKRTSKGTMNVTGKVFRYTTKESKSEYDSNKVKLAKECFSAFDSSFDFSSLDCNNDGYIDSTLFTVPGEADKSNWWPCAGGFGDSWYRVDGVGVGHIITGNSVLSYGKSNDDFVHSYCHELGHCIGLPDYYLYKSEDSEGMHGLAGIELMDTDCSTDFSAFSKLMCGWFSDEQVQIYDPSGGEQSFLLTNAQTASGNCLIIPNGTLANGYFSEFFILEYSTASGNNLGAKQLTWWQDISSGVRVFHISAEKQTDFWTFFRYASGTDYTNNNLGRRLIRIIDDANKDNYYRSGDVITSSISGFNWYDQSGYQSVAPGVKITVGELTGDSYTVTVTPV